MACRVTEVMLLAINIHVIFGSSSCTCFYDFIKVII